MNERYRTLDEAILEAEKKHGIVHKETKTYDFLPGLWYSALRFFGYRTKDYLVLLQTEGEHESNHCRKQEHKYQ